MVWTVHSMVMIQSLLEGNAVQWFFQMSLFKYKKISYFIFCIYKYLQVIQKATDDQFDNFRSLCEKGTYLVINDICLINPEPKP